jgi:magnesium-transporting ATPase (P-type)
MRDVGRIVATTSNTYEDKLTLRNVDVGFVSCGSSYKHDLGQVGGINMLESNINVIIRSILWGRNVVNSVQKFLVMHLTANIVAIVLTIYGGIVWQ